MNDRAKRGLDKLRRSPTRIVFTTGSAAIILAGCSVSAVAEETTVFHRDRAPGIAVENRDITTGSVDCGSKTVHKEDGMGHVKTVYKEGGN